MAAPFSVTAPSSIQNLMNSSSRRFDGKSRSLDDRDYTTDTQCRHLFVTLRHQLDDATSNYRKVICPIPTPFVYEVISLRKWPSSYDCILA